MEILLADNQPKVRLGLRVLLERQPGLKVIGEVTNAEDLLAQVEAKCPDLVLLGWELSAGAGSNPSASSGQRLLSALRRACPHSAVIALSGRPELRRAALNAGADAFVCKCDPPERLLAAIAHLSTRVKYQADSTIDEEVGKCLLIAHHSLSC